MLDDRIKHLDRITQSRALEGLEAAIWAGIEKRSRETRTSRVVIAWQTAVLALVLASSIGAGALTAKELPAASLGVFSPHGSLAPSVLLGGH